MTRIFTLFILLLAAISLRCEAQTSTPQSTYLYYQQTPSEGDDNTIGDPNLGHRTAPAPILCVIDFVNKAIVGTSSLLDEIVEYQLFDAEGAICLVTTTSEQSFVEELTSIKSGEYILLFIADSYQLIGTINL